MRESRAEDIVLSYNGQAPDEWEYAEVSRLIRKVHYRNLVRMDLDGQKCVWSRERPFCVVHSGKILGYGNRRQVWKEVEVAVRKGGSDWRLGPRLRRGISWLLRGSG